MIKLKRAYEKPARDDGERILVERLWPRGMTKLQTKIDLWMKDVAPSAELRKWFGHDPDRWDELRRRYQEVSLWGLSPSVCAFGIALFRKREISE